MRFFWTLTMWLCLLLLPFAALTAVNVAHGPASHRAADACTRSCHDRGCKHLPQRVDMERPTVKAARAVYLANIRALKAPSFGYRDTNLLVYVVGFPSVAALGLWPLLWRSPRRRHWLALGMTGSTLAGLAGFTALHAEQLYRWGDGRTALYWFCTDFCVHMGNLTGLTYDGFNFLLFVVAMPGVLVAMLLALTGRLVWAGAGWASSWRRPLLEATPPGTP